MRVFLKINENNLAYFQQPPGIARQAAWMAGRQAAMGAGEGLFDEFFQSRGQFGGRRHPVHQHGRRQAQ